MKEDWVLGSMRTLTSPVKGVLVSLGGVSLGGLTGWGVASPEASLVIPVLAAGSSIAIALASPPAILILVVLVAPLAGFAHLDLRLAPGVPALSLVRLVSSFLLMLLLTQVRVGGRERLRLDAVDLVFMASIVGIGISLSRSIELVRSAQVYFDSYFIPFLMYFLAKNIIRSRAWLDGTKLALVAVGFYLSALIIHEYVTGQGFLVPEGDLATRYSEHLSRSVVLFGNSAFSGALMAVAFPVALTLLLDMPWSRMKLLLALALPVMGTGLFLTYTRAAWITAFVGLIVIQFFFPRLRRFVLILIPLVAILAVAFWGELASSPIISERVSSQGPVLGRFSLLELSIGFITEQPLWGIGFDNFRYVTRIWEMTDIENTHNSFVFILVSSGLVGLLPYLAGIVLVWREAIQGIRWLGKRGQARLFLPLLITLVSYLGNALVIDMVSAPYLNMVFFLTIGTHLGFLERLKSREQLREERVAWKKAAALRASA